jgi:hypothetical protein
MAMGVYERSPEHIARLREHVNQVWANKRRNQTHCKHGHELTQENVYIQPSGSRACRTCKRDANQRQIINGNRRNNGLRRSNWTLKDYEVAFAAQNGLCDICGNADPSRKLYADHDHSTGQRRSLLCIKCNSALGLFQESPYLLRKAAEYLERNSER